MTPTPHSDAATETGPLAAEPLEAQPAPIEALDIQHDTDPAEDHGTARRIPHLGHAVLFFCTVLGSLAVCIAATYGVFHLRSAEALLDHPGLGLLAQGAGYVVALGISMALFPLLWGRSFFSGVHWNFQIAQRRWKWVFTFGLFISVVAQVALHFVSTPDDAPVDQVLDNARIIWPTAFFAVVLGPLMEELAFRGFLLPALATAYDWLSLERTPAAVQRWQSTTTHSQAALVFSALISSVPFAVMHAAQIGYAWGVVGILYGVSLALSYVRIRTHSLACSTLMHATYNFSIFALLFLGTDGFRHLDKLTK